jgi:hypothetical protein
MELFEGQYLLIFGGIYEITKELNDLHMFDLTKKKWITIFEESNSPVRNAKESSPANFDEHNMSSTLGGGTNGHGSPNIHQKKSIMMQSPTKNLRGHNAVGAGIVHNHHPKITHV